jgi:hypothetical protein
MEQVTRFVWWPQPHSRKSASGLVVECRPVVVDGCDGLAKSTPGRRRLAAVETRKAANCSRTNDAALWSEP